MLVAASSAVAAEPVVPSGTVLREATEEADFDRVAALESHIWGDGQTLGLGALLARRRAFDPRSLSVYVAEADGELVSAAWVRFRGDAAFALLQGGATLREWRGRGIYRALVAKRAAQAAGRPCPYLLVNASDDSRPILERLGFTAITTTTPFRWSPSTPLSSDYDARDG